MELSAVLGITLVLFVAFGLPIVLAILIRKFGSDWSRSKTIVALLAANSPFYVLALLFGLGELMLWALYLWPFAVANMVPSFAIGLLFRTWSKPQVKQTV